MKVRIGRICTNPMSPKFQQADGGCLSPCPPTKRSVVSSTSGLLADDFTLNTQAIVNKYVFVSHSSADKKLVDKVVHQIEKRGIRCWISSRDIRPGRDYQQEIVSNLEGSAVVLLIFSQHANKSSEILKELSLASKFKKPMIPARTEDIVPSGAFQYQLSNAQIIDLFENFDNKIQELCDSIRDYMSTQGESGQGASVAVGRTPRKYGALAVAAAAAALLVTAGSSWMILHRDVLLKHPSAQPLPATATAVAMPPIVPPATIVTSKVPVLSPVPVSPQPEEPAKPNTHQPVSATARASTSHYEKPSVGPPQLRIQLQSAGVSIKSRYPDAKIVSWLPTSKPEGAPPTNVLGSENPIWTIKESKSGQIRLVIKLSSDMVALDHIYLRLEPGSGVASLPKTAVISLSGSHDANLDSFRYVSSCTLVVPGVTRCDFGSQDARSISVELFRQTKPITETALSIGF